MSKTGIESTEMHWALVNFYAWKASLTLGIIPLSQLKSLGKMALFTERIGRKGNFQLTLFVLIFAVGIDKIVWGIMITEVS